jgi:hypothetical protein
VPIVTCRPSCDHLEIIRTGGKREPRCERLVALFHDGIHAGEAHRHRGTLQTLQVSTVSERILDHGWEGHHIDQRFDIPWAARYAD